MALNGWEAKPFCVGPISQSAGGADTTLPVMKTPRKLELSAVKIAVGAAITANDTNYATFTLTDGTTNYATANTKTTGSGGTGNIAANTFIDLTIGTAEVEDGVNLRLLLEQDGAGVDVTNCVVQLEFAYMNE